MCRYIDGYQSDALCCIHSCQMRTLRESKANSRPPTKEFYGHTYTSYSSSSYLKGTHLGGPQCQPLPQQWEPEVVSFPLQRWFLFFLDTPPLGTFSSVLSLYPRSWSRYLIPLSYWHTNWYTRRGIYLFCLNGRNAIYRSIYIRICIKAYLYIYLRCNFQYSQVSTPNRVYNSCARTWRNQLAIS